MSGGIALVTGGGTGIGAACCGQLGAAGFQVAVHYNHSKERAEALVAQIPGAFAVQADLATTEGCDSLVREVGARDGEISVLVNNAGIVLDKLLFSSSLEDFETVINTNLRTAWYLTKKLSKMMMRKRSGRIINISSVIGHTASAGQSLYGMSKAALDNFTKCAAQELAPYGILVNSIAPGFIDTEMTKQMPEERRAEILSRVPLGRMGTALEVAELVGFFATKGGYCTGTTFHVNGGLYGG